MRQGQLARLADGDGRRAERRIVNLAAHLREPGSEVADAGIQDLSVHGFKAATDMALEPEMKVWLKLEGLEPQSCRVVWVKGTEAGFEFSQPLHAATLEMLVAPARRPAIRRRFGPQQ